MDAPYMYIRYTVPFCLQPYIGLNLFLQLHWWWWWRWWWCVYAVCTQEVVHRDGSTSKTCYNLVFAGDSWSVASRHCASLGVSSRLAVITTADQNDVIEQLLQQNGLTESWLAARETTHPWQWLDGTTRISNYSAALQQSHTVTPYSFTVAGDYSRQRLCDCMWDSFDPRERTICGIATVTGGRGAVA